MYKKSRASPMLLCLVEKGEMPCIFLTFFEALRMDFGHLCHCFGTSWPQCWAQRQPQRTQTPTTLASSACMPMSVSRCTCHKQVFSLRQCCVYLVRFGVQILVPIRAQASQTLANKLSHKLSSSSHLVVALPLRRNARRL